MKQDKAAVSQIRAGLLNPDFQGSKLELLNYIQSNFRPDLRDVRWA